MTGQTLYLGMVIAAFATFMGTLGVVSTWIMLSGPRPVEVGEPEIPALPLRRAA